MTGPGLADEFGSVPVLAREEIFAGRVWDVVAEDADLGHSVVRREFVDHPGAVAVIALEGGIQELQRIVHPHPTISEAVLDAARAVDKWATHA